MLTYLHPHTKALHYRAIILIVPISSESALRFTTVRVRPELSLTDEMKRLFRAEFGNLHLSVFVLPSQGFKAVLSSSFLELQMQFSYSPYRFWMEPPGSVSRVTFKLTLLLTTASAKGESKPKRSNCHFPAQPSHCYVSPSLHKAKQCNYFPALPSSFHLQPGSKSLPTSPSFLTYALSRGFAIKLSS